MKYALRQLKRILKISALNSKWKNRNQHNHTNVGLLCSLDCIKVGKETYGTINANNFDNEPSETVGLEIGNYCSIADDVYFYWPASMNWDMLRHFRMNDSDLKTEFMLQIFPKEKS